MNSQPRDKHIGDRPRMAVELTNVCNLHCSYCVRDDDALHRERARFFPVDLLRRVLAGARATYGLEYVTFTGGEVTLHPLFDKAIEAVAAEGLTFGFVTNGWHFDRVFGALAAHRDSLHLVAFSLDGVTREAHDRWRGEGSFVRVVRAVTRCHVAGIPFAIKAVLRRDMVPRIEQLTLLAARLGAGAVFFSHLLPTSRQAEDESSLTLEEQRAVEQEIAALGAVLKMPIGLAAGFYDIDPAPPCSALRGTGCNVDYRGRLTLCCNLSGFRGAEGERDVVADLTKEDFDEAWGRLRAVAAAQVGRRADVLRRWDRDGRQPDLYTGSPCLLCLQSFGKIPWRRAERDGSASGARTLPVRAGDGLKVAP